MQPGARVSIVRSLPMKMGGVAVGRYTIRRLLQMIPVVIGTTFIIYAMVWALPGDPFVGKWATGRVLPAYIAEMRAKFNLDDSLPVQYGKYLWNLLQGNFGESFSGRTGMERDHAGVSPSPSAWP